MYIKQFNVSMAFLYGHMEEEIYMEQPQHDGTNHECCLKKA